MTVEELRAKLEKISSAITSSGFDKIDGEIMNELENAALVAGELDMKEGKRLIVNLFDTMKAIQEGKSSADSGNLRLTALDFYLKKHSDSGIVEEL